MGPTRTGGEPSSSKAAGEAKRKPRRHHQPHKEPAGVPGVQKIKSALRQARRLLAKDKLAANVRVETERKIKALEADLEQAQISKKERANAVRYHKVKFFERQKVVRKLTQTKKRLDTADASSQAHLSHTLTELRVDLNYILHYPKTKKYISLFPPDVREDHPSSPDTPTIKVNPESEAVRSWIRERMEAGELPADPELHLDSRVHDAKTARRSTAEWGSSKKTDEKAPKAPAHDLQEPEDAFFGDDTEDEE
ncbi:hypothetical protein C0992_008295 [Termitomyces sp. T32_za158]|nr:hypothetical protein C0992_008295 [Termitomyces sp. T32_za158]